jgi:hypothetical protein
MPELPPELWERILRLILNPHGLRIYGVNKLFMRVIFADKYRHMVLGDWNRLDGFLPSGKLRKTVIHIRYALIARLLTYRRCWSLGWSQPHVSSYVRFLNVYCKFFDAADIGRYHYEALDYRYAAASVDHTSSYASTCLEAYSKSGQYKYGFCDASLFYTLISRLTSLQGLHISSRLFSDVSSKAALSILKAIWQVHGTTIGFLDLVVDPCRQVDMLLEPTVKLSNLHTLILYLQNPESTDKEQKRTVFGDLEQVLRLLGSTSQHLHTLDISLDNEPCIEWDNAMTSILRYLDFPRLRNCSFGGPLLWYLEDIYAFIHRHTDETRTTYRRNERSHKMRSIKSSKPRNVLECVGFKANQHRSTKLNTVETLGSSHRL